MGAEITRRHFVGGIGAAGLTLAGVKARAATPALPTSPVSISVIDVGGELAMLQKPFDGYRKANGKLVTSFVYSKAPSPELPGKLKAQQDAGRMDVDIVLGGLDILAAGIDQKLWVELYPTYADALPNLDQILQPITIKTQALAKGQAVCATYTPSGPLLEYMPKAVKTPPTSVEELMAWTKANPKRFFYARPANSGPGRTFLMGLPYLLGDKDPSDPVKGWDKTWAYLKELGLSIEYYPGGTAAVMKELGEGSRDMTVTTLGWDINPRYLGTVPKEAKVQTLKGFHWVCDAQYIMVPKGVPEQKLAVIFDLIKWVMSPQQQALTYDDGFFYPGPSAKDITPAMASADSQATIKEFSRPELEPLIASVPMELPLSAEQMVVAFRIWDEQIGTSKSK